MASKQPQWFPSTTNAIPPLLPWILAALLPAQAPPPLFLSATRSQLPLRLRVEVTPYSTQPSLPFIVWRDLDGDRDLDLALVNLSGRGYTFLNEGLGRPLGEGQPISNLFRLYPPLAVEDLDGDGDRKSVV
mgnify:CR=1 FL=1